MGRSNTFMQAGNENREVSIGGRGNSDTVWAWLNTDNGGGSNCAVRVRAEVSGDRSLNGKPRKTCHNCNRKWVDSETDLIACPSCGSDRQGVDTRRTDFTVELPEANDYCSVTIREHGAALADLARIGAMFVGVQVAEAAMAGDMQTAENKLAALEGVLEGVESALHNLPEVTLPGGVSMRHALACVEIVRRLRNGENKN